MTKKLSVFRVLKNLSKLVGISFQCAYFRGMQILIFRLSNEFFATIFHFLRINGVVNSNFQMCKEADDNNKNDEPVVPIIPEGLPEPIKQAERPEQAVKVPKHTVTAPDSENPGKITQFQDLALSDIQENTKAM